MSMKSNFPGSRHAAASMVSAAVFLLVSAGSAGAKATFTTFDVGFVESINSSNTVTGYNSTQAFVRTADGTVTMFDVPGGSYPEALSINDAGAIAGFYYDSSGNSHGFVRAVDGTVTTFDGQQANDTYGLAINNRDEVAGYYKDSTGNYHGFLRIAGGKIRTFDGPGANFTAATSLDDKGLIAGYYAGSDGRPHGFLRAIDGTITTIDVPGADDGTYARAINNKGAVTGSYYNGNGDGEHGFVRALDGTITTFDVPGCDISPIGVNRKGVIAGFCEDRDNPKHFFGFVRKPDGSIKMFHVPGQGPHTMPSGINDLGVIAGDDWAGDFLRFP